MGRSIERQRAVQFLYAAWISCLIGSRLPKPKKPQPPSIQPGWAAD